MFKLEKSTSSSDVKSFRKCTTLTELILPKKSNSALDADIHVWIYLHLTTLTLITYEINYRKKPMKQFSFMVILTLAYQTLIHLNI